MKYSLQDNTWRNKALFWEAVGLISILALEIILTYNRVLYGVELANISMPSDGAYRIFLGQVPSRDFHTPAGFTLFYTLAGFFYSFGGFSFKAIAAYSAVMGAIGTIAVFLSLRLYLNRMASLCFAGITALTLFMPRSHPWKDEPAVLFYLLSLTAFIIAYKYRDKLSSFKAACLAALSGLALTASIFSKHNTGLTAFAFTAPLWLFVSSGKKENVINRIWGFGICLFSTALSTLFLIAYFESKGSFFSDISQSSGVMDRLLALMPHAAIKEWLIRDWGRIVFVVYVTVVTLFIGYSYLLKLNLKKIFKERGLAGTIISLTVVSYIGHLTSESGALPAFEMFSLLLGLLYIMISQLKDSPNYVEVDRRRLSNFCLFTGAVAMITFILWWVTYLIGFPDIAMKLHLATSTGRSKAADMLFLTVMLMVAVILFTSWFLCRKADKLSFSSTKNVFTGTKLFIILLAISPILYFEYAASVYKTAMTRLLVPVLKNTGLVKQVEFKNIPALNGAYADKQTVHDIEGLVAWLRPKLDVDTALKKGTGIYVLPHCTALYGILGVESFKNAYLWLSYGLTFNQPDPDTDEIIKKSPKFIILDDYGNPNDPFKSLIWMPKLQKILQEDYAVVAKFGSFTVFQNNRL